MRVPHTPQHQRWDRSAGILSLVLGILLTLAGSARAQDETILDARVRYVAGGTWYLDRGADAGLAVDQIGIVSRGGVEIATLKVVELSGSTAAAVLMERFTDETDPQVDDTVQFTVVRTPEPGREPDEEPITLKEPDPVPDGPAPGDPDFVPLLARPTRAKPHTRAWIADGYLRGSAMWTRDWTDSIEFITFRASSRGTVDRIFGGPIALQWDVTSDFRTGAGNQSAADYQNPKSTSVRCSSPGTRSAGRILPGRLQPRALPALGRYDGAAFEYGAGDGLRVGVAAGFRPELMNLEPSGRNPLLMAYGVGKIRDGDLSLSASLGTLITWYRSSPDRHAALADLRISVGRVWSLTASSEFDFYGANEAVRSELGLTRLNATTRLTLGILSFRVGWHQNQLRDTLAQRAIVTDTSLYNDGTRRLLAAVSQNIDGWHIDEEFTWWSGSGTGADYQFALRGRTPRIDNVIAFRLGGYWRDGSETDRYGGDLGVFWTPDATEHQLPLDAAVIRPEGSRGTFDFPESTGEVDVNWIISRELISSLSFSFSGSEEVSTSTIMFSMTVRFRTGE